MDHVVSALPQLESWHSQYAVLCVAECRIRLRGDTRVKPSSFFRFLGRSSNSDSSFPKICTYDFSARLERRQIDTVSPTTTVDNRFVSCKRRLLFWRERVRHSLVPRRFSVS